MEFLRTTGDKEWESVLQHIEFDPNLAFRVLTLTAGGRQSITRIEGIRRHRGCAELRR